MLNSSDHKIVFMLVLSLALVCIAACSGDNQEITNIDSPAQTNTLSTSPAEKPTAHVQPPKPITQKTTISDSSIQTTSNPPKSSDTDKVQGTNYLMSIKGCLERELGNERTNELVNDGKKPTDNESAIISNCSKPKEDGSSSTDKNRSPEGNDRNDSQAVAWRLSPTAISCMFSAIGMTAFREVKQGNRAPTSNEIQSAQPCLPDGKSLNDIIHPLSVEQCPSLEVLQRSVREYQARWDQLECHMKEDFQRLPLPSFRTSARINPIVMIPPFGAEVGCQGLLCPQGTEGVVIKDLWNGDLDALIQSLEAESWEEFAGRRYPNSELDYLTALQFTEAEFPSANFTFLPMNIFMPNTDELGENHTFPTTDYWHDVALRAYTPHVILRKRDGHITSMNLSFGGNRP